MAEKKESRILSILAEPGTLDSVVWILIIIKFGFSMAIMCYLAIFIVVNLSVAWDSFFVDHSYDSKDYPWYLALIVVPVISIIPVYWFGDFLIKKLPKNK